jgi:Cd2+/Zn2+-exporting ATPase
MSDTERAEKERQAAPVLRCELTLSGLDCPDCARTLAKAVNEQPGVRRCDVSYATGSVNLELDPSQADRGAIEAIIRRLGFGVVEAPRAYDTVTFHVEELDCSEELAVCEKPLAKTPGIREVTPDYVRHRLAVTYDRSLVGREAIARALAKTPYHVQAVGKELVPELRRRQRVKLLLTLTSGLLLAAGAVGGAIGGPRWLTVALSLGSIAASGRYVIPSALFALWTRSLDMNVLMTLAVAGALAIGEWSEGATVFFLFALAQLLESRALERARRAVEALMELAPETATVLRSGAEAEVPVEAVLPGEVVMVKPGERVPLDGRVVRGASSVDESPITGESLPREKVPGEEVFAGSINQQSWLEVEVTRPARESTLARILHMVEDAQPRRAESQTFIERFARWYTPTVITLAGLLGFGVPLALGEPFFPWFYRALVLLVIACPCALVISTPVTVVTGLTRAARAGALIKGGRYLEALADIDTVVLDKTGTLTYGRAGLVEIAPAPGVSQETLLQIAASLEAHSEHHLAAAVLEAARERDVELLPVAEFEARPGEGVVGVVRGERVAVGNARLMGERCPTCQEVIRLAQTWEWEGKRAVMVGSDRRALGVLAIADLVRREAPEAVRALRRVGVKQLVMLTGDNAGTAEVIARCVELDQSHAQLLPQDKVDAVTRLVSAGRRVVMVGDGVNDAPALAAATVGVAMGTAGTDVALETADVALMGDDLRRLPFLIRLAKRARWVLRENVTFAVGLKLFFVALVLVGWATLWLAVVADMGASLAVIFNALRLLGVRD